MTGYVCPFLKGEKKKESLSCELCSFKFPDKAARREIVYGYCANTEGYKSCMLYKVLSAYYERKYAVEKCKTNSAKPIDKSFLM